MESLQDTAKNSSSLRYRVGPTNIRRALHLQEKGEEGRSPSRGPESTKKEDNLSWATTIMLNIYYYYRALLSDSEVWGPSVEIRNKTFLQRLSGVTLSFLLCIGLWFTLWGHFLSPSLVAWASVVSLLAVPLIYWVLGRAWVRFCKAITKRTCLAAQPPHLKDKRWRKRDLFFVSFIGLQIGLSVVSLCASLLNAISESKVLSLLTGMGCFVSLSLVSFGTHGVGGKLRHNKLYRFYQPFEGGTLYCILQASSWILFSLSFLLIGLHSSCTLLCLMGRCSLNAVGTFSSIPIPSVVGSSSGRIVARLVTATDGILIPATSAAVVAEILLVISLTVFEARYRPSATDHREEEGTQEALSSLPSPSLPPLPKSSSSPAQVRFSPAEKEEAEEDRKGGHALRSAPHGGGGCCDDDDTQPDPSMSCSSTTRRWYHGLVIMAFAICLFKPEMVIFGVAYGALTAWAPNYKWVVIGWVFASAIYVMTYRGRPAATGERTWPLFQRVSQLVFDNVFVPYFELEIIRGTPEPFEVGGDHKYIFGYHPHGIIPIACQWTSLTSKWSEKFPGLQPAVLVSTIVHNVPIMRDVAQWNGSFEVTRHGFLSALRSRGSVLLVPGGQEEMIGSRSDSHDVPIVTSHRGFIRLALMSGAKLVPVYAFGETQTFDNVSVPASWQRWCVKTFRANLICYPYGVAPMLPRPHRFTLAVGRPISVPRLQREPSEEQLAYFHHKYFTALRALFNRYKQRAGRGRDKLVFTPALSQPPPPFPRGFSAPPDLFGTKGDRKQEEGDDSGKPTIAKGNQHNHQKEASTGSVDEGKNSHQEEEKRGQGHHRNGKESKIKKKPSSAPKLNEFLLIMLMCAGIFGSALQLKLLGW